ncbi:hypothetical protein D6D23_06144 [Aureobasidium pullulans]|nr:hypothetical protein D6D23_06144 [Aureobasidium pullulans]THZ26304.1 hypothetical protein D6C89_03864 [Aureobasidium pullulans]THZ95646.1 hypothetical protein D6C82_07572 [Aureobasidium pullulans]
MARTRSQSREPDPQASRRAPNARKPQQQLQPLPEDDSEVEDNVDGDDDVDVDQQSTGGLSQSTGPRYDTFSQTELQLLDPENMESNLEDLNSQARKLLAQFRNPSGRADELKSLIRQFQNPDSRERQKVKNCWADLQVLQSVFTSSGEYLKPETILRSLLRKKHTQPLPKASKPWRPDDVIYKANLAILVHTVMTGSADHDTIDALMGAEQIFSSPFALKFVTPGGRTMPGHSNLIPDTFEFALELRTQVLVGNLQANMTQSAAAFMIRNAMLDFDDNDDDYGDDASEHQMLNHALSHNRYAKGWELLDPHTLGTEEYAGMIIRRAGEITTALFSDIKDPFVDSSASLESGLAKLRKMFPWEQFQKHLLRWANLRLSEIDNSIKQLGGIDEIVAALEQEIRNRLDNPHAYDNEDVSDEQALPSVERNTQLTSSRATPASVASTKQRAKLSTLLGGRPKPSTSANISSAAHPERTRTTTQVDANAEVIDNVESTAAPRLDPAGKLARANALDEQARQKRRFIDPQPDGVRIVDDITDSQPATQTRFRLPGTSRQPSSNQNLLDPALQNEEETERLSDDENFFQTQDDAPVARPRPRPSAAAVVNSTQEEPTQSTRRRRSSEVETPNKRRNPGPTIEPFRSTGDDEADAVQIASLNTRLAVRRAQPRAQRARKPWEDAEVGALLRYIRDYGISYAILKKIDEEGNNVLGDRTPEDLRLKAREMKVKFLITEQPLPANLHLVPLGKKEIERVNRFVFYEQEPQRARSDLPAISP